MNELWVRVAPLHKKIKMKIMNLRIQIFELNLNLTTYELDKKPKCDETIRKNIKI